MSVLYKLSSSLGRGDQLPNQILARDIVEAEDSDAVAEVVRGIFHRDRGIQGDCVKVLYEIGLVNPEMIADEVDVFIRALSSRNNQVVWRTMTALSTIIDLKADEIWPYIDEITRTVENGSVITQDYGIRVVAKIAATAPDREAYLLPFLTHFLEVSEGRDMGRHAESMMVMMTPANRDDFILTLENRKPGLSPAQAQRINRLIRRLQKL